MCSRHLGTVGKYIDKDFSTNKVSMLLESWWVSISVKCVMIHSSVNIFWKNLAMKAICQ